jgi:Kae1-associated kinase Bud32
MERLISQGAEAKIYLIKDKVIKDRIPKLYRHPKLDKQIRKKRTKSESKLLYKAIIQGVEVPKVLLTKEYELHLSNIKGDKLSETLNNYSKEKQLKVMQKIGGRVALLHKINIIHGDLTTSNMILSESSVYLIDFGLGFFSTKIEDKAVDLHLIKQALEAKHFQNWKELFNEFSKSYKWEDSEKVLSRLEVVEKRGRYKH